LGAPGFPDLPGGQKLDSTTSPLVVLFWRHRRFPSVPGPRWGQRGSSCEEGVQARQPQQRRWYALASEEQKPRTYGPV